MKPRRHCQYKQRGQKETIPEPMTSPMGSRRTCPMDSQINKRKFGEVDYYSYISLTIPAKMTPNIQYSNALAGGTSESDLKTQLVNKE